MRRSSESALINFLGRLLADRSEGRVRPLDEYLALYPGHEAEVRAEYARIAQAPVHGAVDTVEQHGPYRLVRELGRGGQGTVWLAEDTRLGRVVALKLVRRSPLFDRLSPRLQREAEVVSSLDHPGICAVFDVGSDAAVSWMAMRFIEGETFEQRLKGELLQATGGDWVRHLALVEGVARALHVAHEAGIVHRDVKPANVMITSEGEPVVLDFGVARQDEGGPPLTLTGEVFGTPAYMAPEQLSTRGVNVDRRVDVWSLGVLLYEALAGERPFEAPTREGLVRCILEQESEDLAGVPRDLAVVVRTALCKDLDGRYRTALDLAEDLRRVREHEPIRARPAGVGVRLRRWTRRNPKLAVSQAALLLTLGLGLAVTLHLLGRTRATLEEVSRLSDQKVTADLLVRERELWPAAEEQAPALEVWLRDARGLLERRSAHGAAREAASARIDQGAARETDEWLVGELDQLLASLSLLEQHVPRVEERALFAREVRQRSVVAHRSEWDAAIQAVAEDSRYQGLALTPQLGLVPLGADLSSGLQEFAHLQSGVVPVRDPESGALRTEAETGLVFVLIPGGLSRTGCEPPTPDRPVGSPHVDALATDWDHPTATVRLDPFFLSKYELTQAQWRRHTRANPSAHSEGAWIELPDLHPVEQISWEEATLVLEQLSLALPTEAQWERGARGGTTTPWFTGESRESLQGFANLADRYARDVGGGSWEYEPWLEDGSVLHAPVGLLGTNAFGLHDTLGNVEEWCQDWWSRWGPDEQLRDGDGLFMGETGARIARGGHFASSAATARCGARAGFAADTRSHIIGVRPARRVVPEPD